jgi:3-oxoacyl-[acyl-carrier-protein] synthase II
VNILGTGIIFAGGSGTGSFENALKEGWQPPGKIDTASEDKFNCAYQVDMGAVPDRALIKKIRRSDKLSKMAVVAASEALKNSGIEDLDKKKTGIITATALGAHVTTFGFLDDILEYGEASVSPTTFSNSVHNAAASYISLVLGIQGPTLTVTQFFFSFHNAMQLAQLWLDEKRCEYILVGAVEQYGDVLAYIHDSKLTTAPGGKIMPFNLKPTFQVPGEGAVFFLLSNKRRDTALCEVQSILNNDMPREDICIVDTDGLLEDESVYEQALSADIPAASYSPIFGSMMSGSAFNCAAGVMMLKEQIKYANPVTDNPHGLNIINETGRDKIESIRCIRYNCYGNKEAIYLKSV